MGEYKTTERKQPHRGTPLNAQQRLNLATPPMGPATFWRIPPKFPNIFCAGQPLSQRPIGKGGNAELPNTKGAPRSTAERPNLPTPPWDPPYFVGFRPKSIIFLATDASFTNTKLAKGECKTAERKKKASGTPRNAAGLDGAPKFSHPGLESAKFRRNPPEFPDIFSRRTPRFSNAPMANGEMRLYRTQKDTPRNTTERHGTPKFS